MNDLLELAIKAHGGLERWSSVASINAPASITGAIWYVKGQPDVLKDVVVKADTESERLAMSFVGKDKR